MTRILLIDDDAGGRQMARFNLEQAGYDVDEASDGRAGVRDFEPSKHALVITDVRMPGLSGIEVTREVRRKSGDTPVLVITAFGTIETAVDAMKAGANDFILKPFSRDHLLLMVERALEHRRLRDENKALKRRLNGVERAIIGDSAALRAVVQMADRVAASDAVALITGESGSGKELIARRIHARSERADQPFVAFNCAAIPAELLEAELFGHEKGAFTGAARARPGRFRQADGGSLFLDEVADLPVEAQGKLLRVLQEGVVDVLGKDEPVRVSVRLIAATNRDLRAAVDEGSFREDLYFRLQVVELHLPALRERREDIAPLVRHFIAELAPGRELHIPDEVLRALGNRHWRGNIRELRNACERMVVLSPDDTLSLDTLPPESPAKLPSDDGLTLPEGGVSLVDLERDIITRVLQRCGGNISEAARYLKVPRHILVYRIEKHGIKKANKNNG